MKLVIANDTLVCDDKAHKVVMSTHSHFFWMTWILFYAYSMHWFDKYTLLQKAKMLKKRNHSRSSEKKCKLIKLPKDIFLVKVRNF